MQGSKTNLLTKLNKPTMIAKEKDLKKIDPSQEFKITIPFDPKSVVTELVIIEKGEGFERIKTVKIKWDGVFKNQL